MCYYDIHNISKPSFLLLVDKRKLFTSVPYTYREEFNPPIKASDIVLFFEALITVCRLTNSKTTTHCIASRQCISSKVIRHGTNVLMIGAAVTNQN